MMNDPSPTPRFWLGNAILAVALLMLLYMGQLWESIGVVAMALWMVLVIVGVLLLANDKGTPPDFPG